jgi:hypothetical protein
MSKHLHRLCFVWWALTLLLVLAHVHRFCAASCTLIVGRCSSWRAKHQHLGITAVCPPRFLSHGWQVDGVLVWWFRSPGSGRARVQLASIAYALLWHAVSLLPVADSTCLDQCMRTSASGDSAVCVDQKVIFWQTADCRWLVHLAAVWIKGLMLAGS